jgi:hypothetical protein
LVGVSPRARLIVEQVPAGAGRPQWPAKDGARKVVGWPKRYKLAHAFMWEYSCKGLELAQVLGQLGGFHTRRAELHLDGREIRRRPVEPLAAAASATHRIHIGAVFGHRSAT